MLKMDMVPVTCIYQSTRDTVGNKSVFESGSNLKKKAFPLFSSECTQSVSQNIDQNTEWKHQFE